MQSESELVANNDDEAAFVDAFFLPGGILDPEEDGVSKKADREDDLPPPAPTNPSSLLFSTTTTWFSETADAEGANSKSASITPPGMSSGVENETPLLFGLQDLQSSVAQSDSIGFPDLTTPSVAATADPSLLQQEQKQPATPQALILETILQQEQEQQHQEDSNSSWILTTPTDPTQTDVDKLPRSSTMSPAPPPGFERTPTLSAQSPSFTPSSLNKVEVPVDQPPTELPTKKQSENRSRAQRKKSSKQLERDGTVKQPLKNSSIIKTKTHQKALAASSPYREAVVSMPAQKEEQKTHLPENKASHNNTPPRKDKKKQQKLTGHNSQHKEGQELGHESKISDSSQKVSSHSDTVSDPSSSGNGEDDFQDAEILFHQYHEYRMSEKEGNEDSGWNEIARSSSQHKVPNEHISSLEASQNRSQILQRKDFLVLNDEEEEGKHKSQGSGENPISLNSTSRTSSSSKNKNSSRRQHQGYKGGNEDAGQKNKNNSAQPSNPREQDGLDVFLNMFVTTVTSFFDIVHQVFQWLTEILLPALRQSMLASASSALHSLRGIFLLLLAAFHAYSFAADETLAQLNLESAWIPYVSLIYAPTMTRHLMNFLDLPQFTPHLASSAVLCFLFRRPGYMANSKRLDSGKPTADDIHNLLLRGCQIFIPFDLIMGHDAVNTSIMTLSYTDRLLLAFAICVLRKGWVLVPCAWLSFAVQSLVAAYWPYRHILAEPILLFILFSIGMASLNVLRILDHWKQRAKKAIGKSS